MSKLPHALAAVAAVVMLAAGSSGAMAGHKHFKHHGFGFKLHHFHHHHYRPVIRFSHGGCGYYYDRWMYTGKFYWKSQYYQCKGWW